MLLLLVACQDYNISGGKEGVVPATDSGESVNDTAVAADSAVDTSVAPVDACPEDWPDRAVEVVADCPGRPEADFELRPRWTFVGDLDMATVHAGRFADIDGDGLITGADPMSLWAVSYSLYDSTAGAVLVDAEGVLVREDLSFAGTYRTYARTADYDPARPGMEAAVMSYVYRDQMYWSLEDEAEQYLSRPFGEDYIGVPWFADLDGDGLSEVLVGSQIGNPATGAILGELEGGGISNHTVTADLDLDGSPEIVTLTSGGDLGIWPASGVGPIVCELELGEGEASNVALLAVGNLDADVEGEIVVAGEYVLAICDTDGTLLATITTESPAGPLVGIGELDGDSEPEIVLDYNGNGTTNESGLVAYDHNLVELWRTPIVDAGWTPFSLADLDGDGRHEIVGHHHFGLSILDGEGAVLATADAIYNSNHWKNVPLVVDLDGDDLAEIVLAGVGIQVWENAAGGWLVEGSDVPSPGVDHHPGILGVDGSVPSPEPPFWQEANVWQGHPAGAPGLPDLQVGIEAVCAESCEGDLLVTVYVSNAGGAEVVEPVPVLLQRDDGVELATGLLPPPLAAGESRALVFRVAVADSGAGLVATLDPGGRILECDETDQEAVWREMPCP